MASYDFLFNALGLREWCDVGAASERMSMAELMARISGETARTSLWDLPFPSLDALNSACNNFPRTSDLTRAGVIALDALVALTDDEPET